MCLGYPNWLLMINDIKTLREKTKMSQSQFANAFEIPLSTLRKWEQGESNPAEYTLKLIAKAISIDNPDFELIKGNDRDYYYDPINNIVYDSLSNGVKIKHDLHTIKKQNLPIYLDKLFNDYYIIQDTFNDDCDYDLKEDIIWSVRK